MSDHDLNMEETQRHLMHLLVSKTLKKHGIKKGEVKLSDTEKEHLRQTISYLQAQYRTLIQQKVNITEEDVNPVTNVYDVNKEK